MGAGGAHLLPPAPGDVVKCRGVIWSLIVGILFLLRELNWSSKQKIKCYIQLLQGRKIQNYENMQRFIQEHNRLSKEGLFWNDYSIKSSCSAQSVSQYHRSETHSCHSALPKRKKDDEKCLQSQDKFCTVRFSSISVSISLPSKRQCVGVCMPCTCLLPSSLRDFLWLYNRRMIIC